MCPAITKLRCRRLAFIRSPQLAVRRGSFTPAWSNTHWQNKAGVKLPRRTASCGDLMNAAKAAGCWVVRDFQPGDVVIYDLSGRQKTTQHCGIVEQALPDYGVQAIEGNTSQGGGSQDNGRIPCTRGTRGP